ncbi:hypothetical protein [Poseidonocella sedimentorum]|uniref:Uncharacterized protein n=1 Tax=Poseidonocella sedimentorum TaxID=871652 RepID=A0A1I6EIJ7_9RHOB|nr:hypothetical protein [Poseidonocella sedimentorum]SFR17381.1 hypothetical protein SAMN04515673_11263 [Poseidonocella sedimentorum]
MPSDAPTGRSRAALGLAGLIALCAGAVPALEAASGAARLLTGAAEEVALRVETPGVDVAPLGAEGALLTGLLPFSVTGLPPSLWAASDGEALVRALARLPAPRLPALQDQLHDLLLAEASPPKSASGASSPTPRFLTARIDALLRVGAVEEAGALLDRLDIRASELTARAFDIALLIGTENTACARIDGTTVIAPSLPARIFCLARGGDWSAAALAFGTGGALGRIPPADEALLERFLHPEFYEEAGPLPPPAEISPLRFRIHESLGEPLPTEALPLTYAVSDLRGVSGWRAQITAAERLAAAGALPGNRLLAILTERSPAASGGIWDRAEAVQALDRALIARDAAAVAGALPEAWARAQAAGLAGPLAEMFGQQVWAMGLSGTPGDIAFDLALLTDAYESAARARRVSRRIDGMLIALAKGQPGSARPRTLREAAIRDGFTLEPPAARAEMLAEGRLGEAVLAALADLSDGPESAPAQIRSGLSTLRAAGLEDTARRTGLQLLLLGAPE